MQRLYGSNNMVWRKEKMFQCFRHVCSQVWRGCEQTETDSGAKISIGFFIFIFFALSLTMMLLRVRAEECCFWRFEVSFQVKMILLCIQILPNAFKNDREKKDKKKTSMPIEVDCRLVVDAWLILLASWNCPSANLPCQRRSVSILIGSVVCEWESVCVCEWVDGRCLYQICCIEDRNF